MTSLFDVQTYMPHGMCLFWEPWLVALYAGSDVLIAVAYFAIPFALIRFVRRRHDLRHRELIALFAAFILLCGLTHVASIVTLWLPLYPLHGLLKLATGLVSLTTAAVLFRLIPTLVGIPSPARLEAEIAAHERTLARLREARDGLEDTVKARTAELVSANERLSVLSREAVHRSRNLLSVVDSLARATARSAPDIGAFLESYSSRLEALANATAAILGRGARNGARLEDVARRQLAPAIETYGDRLTVEGPEIEISGEAARQVTLALHELATNAVKFGALANPEGRVALRWERAPTPSGAAGLRIDWIESGGPPPPPPSGERGARRGFGTILLTEVVPRALDGSVRREMGPDGLRWTLIAPLSAIAAPPASEAEPTHASPGAEPMRFLTA